MAGGQVRIGEPLDEQVDGEVSRPLEIGANAGEGGFGRLADGRLIPQGSGSLRSQGLRREMKSAALPSVQGSRRAVQDLPSASSVVLNAS